MTLKEEAAPVARHGFVLVENVGETYWNACRPVWARPRISAWMSCVPS